MGLLANIADQHGISWVWDGENFFVLECTAYATELENWVSVGSARELMHWLGY